MNSKTICRSNRSFLILGVADIHCRIEVVRADDSQDEDYKFRLVTLAGTYLNGTALANTPTKNSKTKERSKIKKVFVIFFLNPGPNLFLLNVLRR